MRKKILSLPLLIALSLSGGQAGAVGLGQIEVQSRLNQPLVAEIRLLQVAPGELDRMHVRLASPEAFARVGLDRPSAMTANLQFALDTNARGEPVIRVTTPNRVNDPFLSFLLEIEWGAGRLVREYNVLLDPPYMAPATRAQVAPATTAPPAPVQQAPVVEAPRQPAPPPTPASAPEAVESVAPVAPPAGPPSPSQAPSPTATPAPAAASIVSTGAGGTFTVAAGQTLSGIANRERDADIGVNQMMIALLRANPEAFIDGNINLLRAGAVMRLPSRDEVTALRAAEANAIVSEQVATWNARRAPVPQPAETPRQEAARGQVVSDSEARLAIVPPAGEDGQSGAQSGAAAGGEGTQLRVELTQAEEEIAARDAEIEEMRSRMDELESLAESQARMIELRNQEMQDMQRQLREAREADAVATPAADERVPATATPWYLRPFTLAGLALLVVGALVWLFTRRRREPAVAGGRSGPLAASIEAARTSKPAPAPLVADTVDEDAAEDDDRPHAETEEPSVDDAASVEASDGWDEPVRTSGIDVQAVPAMEPDGEAERDTGAELDRDFISSADDGQAVVDGDLDMEDWGEDSGVIAAPVVAGTDPGDASGPAGEEADSVATKLELARAYIDIGDLDGARSMLEEVREEGTAAQQAQARELLDGLR